MDKRLLSFSIIALMCYGVSPDFTQDQKECKDELISLSACISFVNGAAKAPTPSCCTDLGKDADKSKYCLCVLVKDRNEPGLGFNLNATLVMTLLPLCRVHTNATVCPELLHLSPSSPEAQVFEQFGNISGVGSGVPSSSIKLRVKGLKHSAIIGILIICFYQQHLKIY